ncbi:MAG: ATP12 family protein [Paracoccaceae bacterium]
MSGWKAKRFWTEARAEDCEGGFTVRLDGRGVKTPAKVPLVVPTRAMAQAIAAEWDAQVGEVKPETMPVTRAANSAIDKIVPQRVEVVEIVAAYGASDLLCYRATGPEALIARQAEGWDGVLDWVAGAMGARLVVTQGVIPVAQPAEAVAALRAQVAGLTAFQLAAFHDLVAISGSLVLALAVIHGRLSPDAAWRLSRIDESWQVEQWGEDEEAAAMEAGKRVAFGEASRFFSLCG